VLVACRITDRRNSDVLVDLRLRNDLLAATASKQVDCFSRLIRYLVDIAADLIASNDANAAKQVLVLYATALALRNSIARGSPLTDHSHKLWVNLATIRGTPFRTVSGQVMRDQNDRFLPAEQFDQNPWNADMPETNCIEEYDPKSGPFELDVTQCKTFY
jgi:hypothetical protein